MTFEDRRRLAGPWRGGRFLLLGMTLALLAACATTPPDGTSRVPAQLDEQTSRDGLFTQPVKWSRTQPGCTGECPKITLDAIVFPGHARLNEWVDHALAAMTWLDTDQAPPYDSVQAFETYFWKTANARDEVYLQARARYRNRHLTVIELDVSLYQTGMAHGMSGAQFINWDNAGQKMLVLDDLLAPGARSAFERVLREAHAQWVAQSTIAQSDPANFDRMWPFVPSDNVGLTDLGLVVKYQPYEIAPYVAGKPELLIPYARLHGILRPAYLPPPA